MEFNLEEQAYLAAALTVAITACERKLRPGHYADEESKRLYRVWIKKYQKLLDKINKAQPAPIPKEFLKQ